jgi:RNA 2',3'-cyclic 3'-phosphodiesterase
MRSIPGSAANVSSQSSPVDRLRLFAAIELPDSWREGLSGLQNAQRRASPDYFRWVAPSAMHLTVVFLGNQEATALAAIGEALARAAARVAPFVLRAAEPGTFGPRRAPRVLWAGVSEPTGRLVQLRREVDRELQAAGIEFDTKPLVPHITLGRARHGAERFQSALSKPRLANFRVEHLVLVESQLGPGGPTHIPRYRADLKGLNEQAPRPARRGACDIK